MKHIHLLTVREKHSPKPTNHQDRREDVQVYLLKQVSVGRKKSIQKQKRQKQPVLFHFHGSFTLTEIPIIKQMQIYGRGSQQTMNYSSAVGNGDCCSKHKSCK
jgi:hypothetical protein